MTSAGADSAVAEVAGFRYFDAADVGSVIAAVVAAVAAVVDAETAGSGEVVDVVVEAFLINHEYH
jgi:hypothetical protein